MRLKWYNYLWNPIGTLLTNAAGRLQDFIEGNFPVTEHGDIYETKFHGGKNDLGIKEDLSDFLNGTKETVKDLWDDYTGKSQIKLQNQLNREMAEEEYQRNLQSIGDTAAAYEAAGLNRNLLYGSGGSPMSYSAPDLQAYSGSAKLDTILSRVGKVLSFLPAMYNATASLERIDQEREKTKQSQIRTMADGISLLSNGYRLSDLALTRPYGFTLSGLEGGKRHIYKDAYNPSTFIPHEIGFSHDPGLSRRYMDAALKNQFDLLESIGISNQLRQTRNSYLGYQYGLDRRFGAAGRIVGMASQGLGAASRLMTPSALKFWGFR